MKVSPYLNINRVEFMVTYQCSGNCKHCSVGDRLNRSNGSKHVSASHAAKVVEELSQMFPISSVMTFGGEPLLYADVVCIIHETANRCGIGSRQLITNGYFTKNDERRKQVAKSLREAGVNNLLLSVDAFHQEFIPVETVHSFAEYAKEADIPNVSLHPAWVVNELHSNPYNDKTKEIVSLFSDLGLPVSAGNNIFMAGNAALYLAEYYDKPKLVSTDSCGSMPYTEPLNAVTSLSVNPNGDIVICDFVIGNILRQSIREIIAQYDPYQNEWMNAILMGGAAGLLELSKQKGMDVDYSQCYSVCDLCRKISSSIKNNSQSV